jgi:MOSC domain-containing protein
MTAEAAIGLVSDLWRFPIKSIAGERLREAWLTDQGVLGDRAFALLDVATNSVVSASNRHFPGLLDWHATYLEPPHIGAELPKVRIALPDGTSWTTQTTDLNARLSGHFGRDVTLVRERPPAYAAKQAAFFAGIGIESMAPTATLVDFCPISVISSATLAEFSRLRPVCDFDARRFRMNVYVALPGVGFVENAWVGRRLAIGDKVRLHVALPDPRCGITTLPQGELPKDPLILRTIAERNTLSLGSGGREPCAGVYATVTHPGLIRQGDPVTLVEQ